MIIVLGPAPEGEVKDGFKERVYRIDQFFLNFNRVYFDFTDAPPTKEGKEVVSEKLIVYRFQKQSEIGLSLFLDKLKKAKLVYCHSIYRTYPLLFARNLKLLQQLRILDFHGVVPEENAFLGKRWKSLFLNCLEKKIVKSCFTNFIVVTRSMRDFYFAKYPKYIREHNTIILPPVGEDLSPIKDDEFVQSKVDRYVTGEREIAYVGGIQRWQNLDAVASLLQTLKGWKRSVLLSEKEGFESKFGSILRGVRIDSVAKKESIRVLSKAHFSIILRDDHILNQVSFPTKLFEAVSCASIPVVRSKNFADINFYGFSVISESDLKTGSSPDHLEYAQAQKRNRLALSHLEEAQKYGASLLRGWIDELSFDAKDGKCKFRFVNKEKSNRKSYSYFLKVFFLVFFQPGD